MVKAYYSYLSNSNFIRTPQHFFSNLGKHRGHSHTTFSCQIKICSLCHFFTIHGLHDPFNMSVFFKNCSFTKVPAFFTFYKLNNKNIVFFRMQLFCYGYTLSSQHKTEFFWLNIIRINSKIKTPPPTWDNVVYEWPCQRPILAYIPRGFSQNLQLCCY